MAEPLFGSMPQLWPAIPVQAFGYLHPALSAGKLPFGAASAGMMSGLSTPFTNAVAGPPQGSPADAAAWPANGVPPNQVGAGVPVFTGTEIAVGIPPQALLAAVAVRRGQPMGPTNDQETEDFICDALDLLSGANDVEVRCEAGRAIFTGTVPHKRLKRDVGEIAWAIPSVNDVQNTVTIAARRRARGPAREADAPAGVPGRKPA